ncbi:MAG: IS3 family transposase [Candidatus Taylorbacteria bacterium]|nr:IS3 family transposase [Candidatus Taylorbacteria bacterium]
MTKSTTSIRHCSWNTLREYLYFYNSERIHLGKYLQGLTPEEKRQQWLSTVLPLKGN